jgi:hypothetical protein
MIKGMSVLVMAGAALMIYPSLFEKVMFIKDIFAMFIVVWMMLP